MGLDQVTRRDVLGSIGAGVGVVATGTGTATADRPDRHVVGTASATATDAARGAAESVHRVLDFGDVGQAVAGRFAPQALDRLRRRDDVRYVEADGQYDAIAETVPWGIDRVDADVVHDAGQTGGDSDDGGGGADVAIVDTGIDGDHPDLETNVGTGQAFTSCRGPNCTADWADDNDHGTHCAGIADAADNAQGVVGVSTAATLHAVKVLDADGRGYWSDIAAGIEWVADRGYDVASMSLGGGSASSTVRDACQYADSEGVLLVAAAGNDGPCTDCVSYPAAYDTVMAVTATGSDDALADFSSTGPEVDVAAPGEYVYSTVVDGYATFSGTSMACPHVAGAGAQLMDNGYTNAEARTRLTDTAEDVGLAATESGAGLLDVGAAVDTDTDAAPGVSWLSPTDGATLDGTVTVELDASDAEDGASDLTVEYRVDGGSWRATALSSAGTFTDSWDTTAVADGDHTLDARVTDTAGNTGTATIGVTTENADGAPSVSWVAPAEGETVSGSVALELDASDAEDAASDLTVEWQVDDGPWRTAAHASGSTFTDSWDSTAVADGDHALDARVTDTAGNVSAQASRTVTVSNAAAAPTVESYAVTEAGSPNPHAEISADWAVGDENGDLASVVVDVRDASTGAVVATGTTDVGGVSASGTDAFTVKHASGATFDVTLTVTDAAGESAAATRTVTE